MAIAGNERGERLVSVNEVDEIAANGLPVEFSLVIGRSRLGYLLVRNRNRAVWELPGGFIDAGESARQCAVRELKEESGQQALNLRWRAAIEIEGPGSCRRYGALYCGEISTITPCAGNGEISAIGFWHASSLPTGISGIDRALLAYFR